MREEVIAVLRNGFDIRALAKTHDITQYCCNGSSDGAIIFFITHVSGESLVVKRLRNNVRCRAAASNARLLAKYQSGIPQQLVFPKVIEAQNFVFECQPYVDGKSLRSLMRIPFLYRRLSGLKTGLDLGVLLLEKTSISFCDYERQIDRVISPPDNYQIPYCLVHNDLAPANILLKQGRGFLIDWEAADEGPAVFNFFDFIFHYTSIVNTGRFSRRNLQSYRNVFRYYADCPSNSEIIVIFKSYIRIFMGTTDIPLTCEYLSKFLAYRSSLTGTHLDVIWKQLNEYSVQLQSDLTTVLSDFDSEDKRYG